MSKERLSRIDYLRDKLSQMGHPPANRILWENELEELLKQPDPVKIKGSVKPRKIPHVAWNRKLMQGHQSKNNPLEEDGNGFLPLGYHRDVSKFIIPPYLQGAWKMFLGGEMVFGRKWGNPYAPRWEHSHWGCKGQRRQRQGNMEVRLEFERQLHEFFRLAPCVPFTECRDRFPEEVHNGDQKKKAEEKRLKEERKVRAAIKAKKKAEAREEKERIQREARADQWERVEAGRQKYLAKFGKEAV